MNNKRAASNKQDFAGSRRNILFSKQSLLNNICVYISIGLTLFSGSLLLNEKISHAGSSASAPASVQVSQACTLTSNIDSAHVATLAAGTYQEGIGQTTMAATCNDPAGFAIYAIGYSNNTLGTTDMIGVDTTSRVATGDWSSRDKKAMWATKLSAVSGTDTLTVDNNFSNYSAIPGAYTKVAHKDSSTTSSAGAKLTITYAVAANQNTTADTYSGKVKYTLVHPSTASVPTVDTMQNVATWGSSLAVGEEVTATDSRDNKSYTVARICTNYSGSDCTASSIWMTQNLDFTIDTTKTYTSNDTDLNSAVNSSGTALSGYSEENDVISWTPGSTLATPATISGTTVTGWTNNYNNPYQAEGGDNYVYTSGTTSNDTLYTSLSACTSAGHTEAECAHYHSGNYYNFSAATAMNDSSSYTTQYTKMPNSICPAGWRLPNGPASSSATTSEFGTMLKAQGVWSGSSYSYATNGFNQIRSTGLNGDPLYFVRSGYVNGSSLNNRSSNGYYWSSAVYSSYYGYGLYFGSSSVGPHYGLNRHYGFSVRCVAAE